MDIKLKYKSWVGQKHADIAIPLTDSDIETYAIEFAEWLVKNLAIPDVMVANADGCPNCGKKEYHQFRRAVTNNKVRKCIWCKTVWETAL